MKKLRSKWLEMKEGFLSRNTEKSQKGFYFAHCIFIIALVLSIYLFSLISYFFNFKALAYSMAVLAIVTEIILLFNQKAHHRTF